MNYLGVDKWNTELSHAWGSRYTAHKYYKKVGEGNKARYFYSPEEYAHFVNKTKGVKERNAAIKKQTNYLNKKLTTLKGFAKKRLNERTRQNEVWSAMHRSNLARMNKDWAKADWKGTHTVGTKSKSIETLRNSASKRNLARDAFASINKARDEAGRKVKTARRGLGTLKNSASKKNLARDAFASINKARDEAGRKVKTARRGLGTLGKSARKNVFEKKKNRIKYEIGPHNRKAKGLSMERGGHRFSSSFINAAGQMVKNGLVSRPDKNSHREARGIRNIGTLKASGKKYVNSLFGKKKARSKKFRF